MEKYIFNNNDIFYEMNHLMFGYVDPESLCEEEFEKRQQEYFDLCIQDKITFIVDNLKALLTYKLINFANLKKEKVQNLNLNEIVQLMNDLALDEEDIWQIIHYILNIIGEFKTSWIILSDNLHPLEPSIDHNLRKIEINNQTRALDVYNFIMANLFNYDYLLSDTLKK